MSKFQELLDRVDARDSLAFREAIEGDDGDDESTQAPAAQQAPADAEPEPTMGEILRRGRALCGELARDAEREWAAERAAKPVAAQEQSTEKRLAALVEGFIAGCREIATEEGSVPLPLRDVYEAAREEMTRLAEPSHEEAQRALHEEMRAYDGRDESEVRS